MRVPDFLPDLDIRDRLRSGGRSTAHIASQVAFVVFLGILLLIGATTNAVILAAVATFVVYHMLRAVLPADRLDDLANDLLTGKAGEDFYDWLVDFLGKIRSMLSV